MEAAKGPDRLRMPRCQLWHRHHSHP
jgi:hypothetical protein